jgi:autotransporter-associated beta strand protein
MRISRFALAATILALAPQVAQAQFTWTGLKPTGWQGQVTPPNDGTANLYFADAIDPYVTLSSSQNDFNTITLALGNNISFSSASPITLTLVGGILSADPEQGDLYFGPNINMAIASSTAYNAGENTLYFAGQVTGTGSLTLIGGSVGNGAIVFNNTSGNSYTGPTTIGDGANFIEVAFWGPTPFGSGNVTLNGNSGLIAHNTLAAISNPLFINPVDSSGPVEFKSWDAPLTFSGPVTLDNNAVFLVRTAPAALPAPLDLGSIQVPGPIVSNPVTFSGGISGAYSMTIEGDGVAILNNSGGNTYTGGTQVGSGAGSGALVFANAASIPASGLIQSEANGYVGIADPTTGSFDSLLSHVNQTSSLGSFGIDTLPGNPTSTYSGTINLSGFANSGVEIGTATSAILTGAIIPQSSSAFQFGGGGGTLYINTPLGNAANNLVVSNPGNSLPLTVYLQNYDYYPGSTTVSDAILIFDGANSLPGGSQLTAAGSGSIVGGSYIGYTDLVAGMTPSTFLSRFSQANTWGIIGFDSSNLMNPVTIGNIDLTGFNNGVFIGTATAAILNGNLTTTSDNNLRLTAVQGGILTVDSAISWGVSLILGSPNNPQYSTGTVILNGANTYTGSTTINGGAYGLTVGLGSSSAFSTGPVSISQGGLVGLEATTAGVNIGNPITFLDPMMNDSALLYLRGSNTFTLSGTITGDASSAIVLENASPLTVTISGNNASFSGSYSVYNGTLNLSPPANNGLGSAVLDFEGPGTIALTGAMGAMNPVVERLNGAIGNGSLGTLYIASGVTATIDTTNDTSSDEPTFGGTIAGPGGLAVTDSSMGASGALVLLFGNNSYTGNTTVSGSGILVAGSDTALGTGTVTVSTNGKGALAVDTGVTLTNPMIYTSGNLVGDGTFAPSNLPTITIASGQAVAGGLPFSHNTVIAGTLSFAGDLAFDNGGEYYWTLQDNGRPDGVSHIDVAGNLQINATGGGFTLFVQSFDAAGNSGGLASNFNVYAPASWAILTTGGSIQNFSAADFTILSPTFEGGTVSSSQFSLSLNGGDQLMLNFTPVPEPSTWALLGGGLAVLATGRARRRSPASGA